MFGVSTLTCDKRQGRNRQTSKVRQIKISSKLECLVNHEIAKTSHPHQFVHNSRWGDKRVNRVHCNTGESEIARKIPPQNFNFMTPASSSPLLTPPTYSACPAMSYKHRNLRPAMAHWVSTQPVKFGRQEPTAGNKNVKFREVTDKNRLHAPS